MERGQDSQDKASGNNNIGNITFGNKSENRLSVNIKEKRRSIFAEDSAKKQVTLPSNLSEHNASSMTSYNLFIGKKIRFPFLLFLFFLALGVIFVIIGFVLFYNKVAR